MQNERKRIVNGGKTIGNGEKIEEKEIVCPNMGTRTLGFF